MHNSLKAFMLGAATAMLAISATQEKPPTAPPKEPDESSVTKPGKAFYVTLKTADNVELTADEVDRYRDAHRRFGRSPWLVVSGHVAGEKHDTMVVYATDQAELLQRLNLWDAIRDKRVIAEVKPMDVFGGGMRRFEQDQKPPTGKPTGGPGKPNGG